MAENDHKRGKMDITDQEKTFNGFIRLEARTSRSPALPSSSSSRSSPSDGPFGCVRPSVDLTGPLSPWRWFWASRPARPTPSGPPDDVVSQARYVPSGPGEDPASDDDLEPQRVRRAQALCSSTVPERVLFDPAGSWRHPMAPRAQRCPFRHVAAALRFLHRFTMHARPNHVVVQELDITAGQAAALIELVEAYGPVPRGAMLDSGFFGADAGSRLSTGCRATSFSHADDGAIRYHPRRAGKPRLR